MLKYPRPSNARPFMRRDMDEDEDENDDYFILFHIISIYDHG